uniref:Uncharacterized protein n=1 Tax=Bartonella schoenbuchensis (strain DSM 13525 / NCTC 13165 / R1) TaxID=687861 RepID=E6YYT4_BARSR|nr:hypothetical protein B11C_20373 [Bartonella schoenbuchensis R1]
MLFRELLQIRLQMLVIWFYVPYSPHTFTDGKEIRPFPVTSNILAVNYLERNMYKVKVLQLIKIGLTRILLLIQKCWKIHKKQYSKKLCLR